MTLVVNGRIWRPEPAQVTIDADGAKAADGSIEGENYWVIGERYFNVRFYSQEEAIRLAAQRR